MAGPAKSKASRPVRQPRPAAAPAVKPAVKVKPHVRKQPTRPAPPQPLGAGHAVENLRKAFPELGG
jgi:hypothetical protein